MVPCADDSQILQPARASGYRGRPSASCRDRRGAGRTAHRPDGMQSPADGWTGGDVPGAKHAWRADRRGVSAAWRLRERRGIGAQGRSSSAGRAGLEGGWRRGAGASWSGQAAGDSIARPPVECVPLLCGRGGMRVAIGRVGGRGSAPAVLGRMEGRVAPRPDGDAVEGVPPSRGRSGARPSTCGLNAGATTGPTDRFNQIKPSSPSRPRVRYIPLGC